MSSVFVIVLQKKTLEGVDDNNVTQKSVIRNVNEYDNYPSATLQYRGLDSRLEGSRHLVSAKTSSISKAL